jgi:uncharacterized RDD family membrane protein YckC
MDGKSAAGSPAGLWRRLAALFYDLLLVVALAFFATFAMLPLTGGEAILSSTQGAIGHAYHAVLLLITFGSFGRCWTHGGQTLGMKAWRIELQTAAGGRLNWPGAAGRFLLGTGMAILAVLGAWYLRRPANLIAGAGAAALVAPFALNFGWIPFNAARQSLQDVAGSARVVRVP